MRLLITDGVSDVGRWTEVTGLGRGVDSSGTLSVEAVERTVPALARFGAIMDQKRVDRRQAMATSASRDASNRDVFFDLAEAALGVRPSVITGDREGRLAFAGATSNMDDGQFVVSDIGGGSTEFVTADDVLSVDIGSVRLTDRMLPDRPPSPAALEDAVDHVRGLFSGLEPFDGRLIGVAGTLTSLSAVDLGLANYEDGAVHHQSLTAEALRRLLDRLALLSVDETAAIPALDPARAPVILAGAVIAVSVVEIVGAGEVLISVRDTLDGLARELLDLA
jgi:exopolyphosphatase/guanosine-5'-triphosphate,3'-diphosphate pyrophosphatase